MLYEKHRPELSIEFVPGDMNLGDRPIIRNPVIARTSVQYHGVLLLEAFIPGQIRIH